MGDVEEINGMSTQLETSKQPKISLMLLSMLRSWNLGLLCPQNPIPFLGKHFDGVVTRRNKSLKKRVECEV
jgi:hypothetical protein